MGNLFESLKDYFENTPKDVIEKDWREIEYLNEIGPDVIEYAEFVRENFGTAVSYSTPRRKRRHTDMTYQSAQGKMALQQTQSIV